MIIEGKTVLSSLHIVSCGWQCKVCSTGSMDARSFLWPIKSARQGGQWPGKCVSTTTIHQFTTPIFLASCTPRMFGQISNLLFPYACIIPSLSPIHNGMPFFPLYFSLLFCKLLLFSSVPHFLPLMHSLWPTLLIQFFSCLLASVLMSANSETGMQCYKLNSCIH